MLAKANVDAHEHSLWNANRNLQDLGQSLVLLSLRLGARATCRPTRYLDLESDPAIQRATRRIVRDTHVMAAVKLQTQLLLNIGELKVRLSEATTASHTHGNLSTPSLILPA